MDPRRGRSWFFRALLDRLTRRRSGSPAVAGQAVAANQDPKTLTEAVDYINRTYDQKLPLADRFPAGSLLRAMWQLPVRVLSRSGKVLYEVQATRPLTLVARLEVTTSLTVLDGNEPEPRTLASPQPERKESVP